MNQLEWKYMILLAKETDPDKAKELRKTLKNIRQCNQISKALDK